MTVYVPEIVNQIFRSTEVGLGTRCCPQWEGCKRETRLGESPDALSLVLVVSPTFLLQKCDITGGNYIAFFPAFRDVSILVAPLRRSYGWRPTSAAHDNIPGLLGIEV